MNDNVTIDSNSLESELSDVTIEINVDGVNDVCSLWKSKINSINIDSINVENFFSSLTDLDIAVSIVSELKSSLESTSNMISSTNSIIKTAGEEQVNIDDSTYASNVGNSFIGLSSSGKKFDANSSSGSSDSSVDNSSLNLTVNSEIEEKDSNNLEDFKSVINVLLSSGENREIATKSLNESVYADLFKETIVNSSATSEEFKSVISSMDTEILQTSLKRVFSNDTSITDASRKVLYTYLEQIVKNNGVGIQNIDANSFAKNVNDMYSDVGKIVYDESLQQTLLNIYDGNNVEEYSSSGIFAIREIVTSLSNDRNVTVEDLLLNSENKQFIVNELEKAHESFMFISNLSVMDNDVALSIINSIVN